MIQKKNQLLNKINEIEKIYEEFILLLNRNQYFSKREKNKWVNESKSTEGIVLNYLYFKDRINRWVAKSGSFKPYLEKYLEYFMLDSRQDNAIRNLHNILVKGSEIVSTRNENYIKGELVAFSKYFDTVESSKLAEQQRRSIIIDEAHNLVVAGAGTGKTSTIIGKIGYILQKGLSEPDEVLVLAFTRGAKKEIAARIKDRIGEGIHTSTFHALGLEIIGKSTGSIPSVSDLSTDQTNLQKKIEEFLKRRAKNIEFLNTLNRYFLYYLEPVENKYHFKSEKEYEKYIAEVEIRTLQGDTVKNHSELEIANYLYLNDVEYEYKKLYDYDTSSEDHPQYKPDFYLLRHNIWIENFGIDENNNIATGINSTNYLEDLEWKRKTHQENYTELVETYTYERNNGTLLENLKEKLEVRGVKFEKIDEELILSNLKDLGEFTEFVGLLAKFLNLFKSSKSSIEELRKEAKQYKYWRRYDAFLDIFQCIQEDYNAYLEEKDEIDFNDMINQATKYVVEGLYRSQYKYILVDEFQDISQSRYKLLNALLKQNHDAKLFCVGDDWQSIFRFAGSDINIMTSFEDYFDPCEKMFLDETFRFNDKICSFSSSFITKNPKQYKKELKAREFEGNAVTVYWYEDLFKSVKETINKIGKREKKAKIYLIGRYSEQYYKDLDFDVIKVGTRVEEPGLEIEYYTAHGSKGKEADYVILIGLKAGRFSFPSEIEDDPVINLLLAKSDEYPYAEERRLFYVSMTRARKHLYILADNLRISSFAAEINQEDYQYELLGNPPVSVECPKCGEGTIKRVNGPFGNFYSCSRYSDCKYKPKMCPECNQGFLYLEENNYTCSKPECAFSARKCPKCEDGYLVLREGNPDFWACSNYTINGCNYIEAVTLNEPNTV